MIGRRGGGDGDVTTSMVQGKKSSTCKWHHTCQEDLVVGLGSLLMPSGSCGLGLILSAVFS